MIRLTLSTIAVCLMSACAAGTPPTPADPIKVSPPASLTAPPQALPPAASGRMPDLEANHRAVAKSYHVLASRYCSLLLFLELLPDDCGPFIQYDQEPP
ncbi:MAG: hypothetical protein QM617_09045 [Comamonas sp.]